MNSSLVKFYFKNWASDLPQLFAARRQVTTILSFYMSDPSKHIQLSLKNFMPNDVVSIDDPVVGLIVLVVLGHSH